MFSSSYSTVDTPMVNPGWEQVAQYTRY